MQDFSAAAEAALKSVVDELVSPAFYGQIVILAIALVLAWRLAKLLTSRAGVFQTEPAPGPLRSLASTVRSLRPLVMRLMALVLVAFAAPISLEAFGEDWMLRIAQGVTLIFVVYGLADRFINNSAIIFVLKWVGIPIALLYVAGWLDDVVGHLDGMSLVVGNIQISLYAVLRTLVFGIVLFWLGRASSETGQRLIRTQRALDVGTREMVAKLFEIGVYAVFFLILVNVMGIDLTALAVFGGALGVGLGFGLQQIASNFISGIIILLDRSLTVGDYIELEDGRSGTLRELSMRSATLQTFDGKDIMVPNEKFITTTFVNWTHNDQKQRYSLNFQVAYDTDLEQLFDIVRETVASHPRVLSGDGVPLAERPDAEIAAFADSGIDILVEFWMIGIDDGENRVGADLLLMIWQALKAHGITIPFPQREVRVLGDVALSK